MKQTTCNIQYNEVIWNQITTEIDNQGKIFVGENEYIQVLPLKDSNFMPGAEKIIELIFNITSQIALGLFVNWLYDKLKSHNINKIVVNKKEYEITDKKSIEIVININIDEK